MRKMFSVNDRGAARKKKSEYSQQAEVEPVTFWLQVQMFYHKATGDSWELRPLN